MLINLPTCSSLDELGSLVWSTERRHHNLIKASGGEGGQPVTSHLATQCDRRENPSVVEQQSDLETSGVMMMKMNTRLTSIQLITLQSTVSLSSHLIMVHVSRGGAPGDRQITCSYVTYQWIPYSSWNCRKKRDIRSKSFIKTPNTQYIFVSLVCDSQVRPSVETLLTQPPLQVSTVTVQSLPGVRDEKTHSLCPADTLLFCRMLWL